MLLFRIQWNVSIFCYYSSSPLRVSCHTSLNYIIYITISTLSSVGQNHYSEKKGRGRGDRKQQQQYDVQSPAPGFTRNSPRQERRGRGSRPRRDDYDRISVSTCSKGRGNSNRLSLLRLLHLLFLLYYALYIDTIAAIITMIVRACISPSPSYLFLRIRGANLQARERAHTVASKYSQQI